MTPSDGIYLQLSLLKKECTSFKDTSAFTGGGGFCLHPKKSELNRFLEPQKQLWRTLTSFRELVCHDLLRASKHIPGGPDSTKVSAPWYPAILKLISFIHKSACFHKREHLPPSLYPFQHHRYQHLHMQQFPLYVILPHSFRAYIFVEMRSEVSSGSRGRVGVVRIKSA